MTSKNSIFFTFLLLCFIIFCDLESFSQANTLVINDNNSKETISLEQGNYLEYCITNSTEEFNSVQQKEFHPISSENLLRLCKENTYWFKFKVKNLSSNEKWVLEQFDFHIGEISFYDPLLDHKKVPTYGYSKNFNHRIYNHKNPTFNLNLAFNQTKTYYVKIQTTINGKHELRIRSVEHFSSYTLTEYYLLGIYYGILIIMFIYYLLIYIPLRDPLYLFFSFFIFCVALYSFSHDGIGFQFLWKRHPEFNLYNYYYSPLWFLIAYVVYTHKFLNLKLRHKKLWLFNWIAVGIYCTIYLIDLYFKPGNNMIYFLPLPITCIYFSCIKSIADSKVLTKYFFAGSTFIMIGSTLFMLNSLNLIPNNIITVYGINLGVLVDILVMTIALGDRLRLIREAKEEADLHVIAQLEITSLLQEKVTKELEEKVTQRTQELEKKVSELDVLNKKLHKKTAIINQMNSALDLDNHKLKLKVKQTTRSWISKSEISFEEFQIMFPNDASCTRELADAKWAHSYHCKKCKNEKYIKGTSFLARRCTKCGYNETPTSNTVFSRIKIPLQKAFYMTYKIIHTNGEVKATELARELDLNHSTCKYFKDRIIKKIPLIKSTNEADFWKKLIHVF